MTMARKKMVATGHGKISIKPQIKPKFEINVHTSPLEKARPYPQFEISAAQQ